MKTQFECRTNSASSTNAFMNRDHQFSYTGTVRLLACAVVLSLLSTVVFVAKLASREPLVCIHRARAEVFALDRWVLGSTTGTRVDVHQTSEGKYSIRSTVSNSTMLSCFARRRVGTATVLHSSLWFECRANTCRLRPHDARTTTIETNS